ncbi:MAG: DUF2461 domain-containing protein [Gemmatimonadales bacterium]|jgi:uncharacterized protein (TIGR02453 family)
MTTFFTPRSLTFLRGLARNNRRDWFEAHRADYETEILAPLRSLVEEMDVRLASLAPEMVGDPRRSVFRIYRDVRFSKDKSPYKTHAACWFYHRDASHRVGQESHGGGGGFYFQIAPGNSFTGGGIWMPPREALAKLRDAMAEKPVAFERTVTAPAVARRFGGLDEDAVLTRVPRGYAPDHSAARWLRYKSFTLGRTLTDAQATGPRLPDLLAEDFALMLPLVRWINGALGLKSATRR